MTGLEYYWPIFDGNTKEIIQGADLYDPINASFIDDKFNNMNSALSLNSGYYKIPSGVYLKGDFSILVWVRPYNRNFFSRIIEFGNQPINDNIFLAYSCGITGKLCMNIRSKTNTSGAISSKDTLILNSWQFIAAVYSQNFGYVYINGSLQGSGYSMSPRNTLRSLNYLGKSNWIQDPDAVADIDDLRIYNRALNNSEILDEYLFSNLNL